MTNKVKLNNKITVKEITDAIQKSGYLLEQRILPIFEKLYGVIDLNSIFPDPVSGKSREIDIKTLGVEKIFDTDDFYCIFRKDPDTVSGNIRTAFRNYPDSITAYPDTLSNH